MTEFRPANVIPCSCLEMQISLSF